MRTGNRSEPHRRDIKMSGERPLLEEGKVPKPETGVYLPVCSKNWSVAELL